MSFFSRTSSEPSAKLEREQVIIREFVPVGATEVFVYALTKRGRRSSYDSNSGVFVGYTANRTTAEEWARQPEYWVTLVRKWKLDDGRIVEGQPIRECSMVG